HEPRSQMTGAFLFQGTTWPPATTIRTYAPTDFSNDASLATYGYRSAKMIPKWRTVGAVSQFRRPTMIAGSSSTAAATTRRSGAAGMAWEATHELPRFQAVLRGGLQEAVGRAGQADDEGAALERRRCL